VSKPQPRQKKTARQRAEEALGVAQRRVAHLDLQVEKARAQLDALVTELAEAQTRLEYVTQDPALDQGASTTTRTTTSGDTA